VSLFCTGTCQGRGAAAYAGRMGRPIVGITADVGEYEWLGERRPRMQSAMTYARAVAAAGGLPMVLPPMVELIADHVAACDAFVFTGGDDPRMEMFGGVTSPRAAPMHPLRQEFEVGLLRALEREAEKPVLGVCLGMQLMALCAGGRLNQCLAETLASHDRHVKDARHAIVPEGGMAGAIPPGEVTSNHRQAAEEAGRLRVVARSEDGVIEAVDDPGRRFYVGVQWHPERTADAALGAGMFERLVRATGRT